MADDPRAEAAARAMAIEGEEDGCFERVAEWQAMEPWEQASEGEPHDDREDCTRWLRKADAGLTAADAVDPFRALLANKDRAIDLIANAIYGVDGDSGPSPLRYAFPVLAALREVAGL